MHACVQVCARAFCMRVYAHTCARPHIRACVRMCMRARVCMYAHTSGLGSYRFKPTAPTERPYLCHRAQQRHDGWASLVSDFSVSLRVHDAMRPSELRLNARCEAGAAWVRVRLEGLGDSQGRQVALQSERFSADETDGPLRWTAYPADAHRGSGDGRDSRDGGDSRNGRDGSNVGGGRTAIRPYAAGGRACDVRGATVRRVLIPIGRYYRQSR